MYSKCLLYNASIFKCYESGVADFIYYIITLMVILLYIIKLNIHTSANNPFSTLALNIHQSCEFQNITDIFHTID